jgi:hypothetical protein
MHAYIRAVLPSDVLRNKRLQNLSLRYKQNALPTAMEASRHALEIDVNIPTIQSLNDLVSAIVSCNSERCVLVGCLPAIIIRQTASCYINLKTSELQLSYPSIAGII